MDLAFPQSRRLFRLNPANFPMRTPFACLCLLAALLPTWSLRAGDQPPIVIILAGQSNMLGQGRRAELAADRRELPANVELVVSGRPEATPLGETFGPELALAHELASAHPDRKFRLLKFAIGTTSIRAWAPDWSAEAAAAVGNESFGALYPRLMEFLRAQLGTDAPPPQALLWFQGERDARFAAAAADYGPRLDEFVRRLRFDLGAPDAWFILGTVNPPYPDAAVVAATQRDTPQRIARAKVVSSEGLTKRADNLHYDTAGQWELGQRFARELMPTLAAPADAPRQAEENAPRSK